MNAIDRLAPGAGARVVQVSQRPRLFVIDDFIDDAAIAHVEALTRDEQAWLDGPHVAQRNECGFAVELPVAGDAVLEDLAARIADILGFANEVGGTLRFRRYREGDYHPLHPDNYRINDLDLIATFLVCLTDVEEGGQTHFPRAVPFPVRVSPRRGRAIVWFNHASDGSDDETAVHEGLPIVRGTKATITSFSYGKCTAAANTVVCVPYGRDGGRRAGPAVT